jgi:hypothetical protein
MTPPFPAALFSSRYLLDTLKRLLKKAHGPDWFERTEVACGAIILLSDKLNLGALTNGMKAELYQTLVRFLVDHEPQTDEKARLKAKLNDNIPPHVAEMFKNECRIGRDGDDDELRVDHVGHMSLSLLEHLMKGLNAPHCNQLQRSRHHLREARKAGKELSFPRAPFELLVRGDFRTIDGILKWTSPREDMIFSSRVCTVLSTIIRSCRAQVIPSLLSASYSFIDAVFRCASAILRDRDLPNEVAVTVAAVLSELVSKASPQEIFFLLKHSKDLTGNLVSCAKSARSILQEGTSSCPERRQLYDTIMRFIAQMNALAQWIIDAQKLHSTHKVSLQKTASQVLAVCNTLVKVGCFVSRGQDRLMPLLQEYSSLYMRAFLAVRSFATGQRCCSPSCLSTETALMRRFGVCGGCKLVTYCSVRCQKSAWRGQNSSHRGSPCRALRTTWSALGITRGPGDEKLQDLDSERVRRALAAEDAKTISDYYYSLCEARLIFTRA